MDWELSLLVLRTGNRQLATAPWLTNGRGGEKSFAPISLEPLLNGLLLLQRFDDLADSVADLDRLRRRLFFVLCRDLTELGALENSVETTTIVDLVSDYSTGRVGSPKARGNPEASLRLTPPAGTAR